MWHVEHLLLSNTQPDGLGRSLTADGTLKTVMLPVPINQVDAAGQERLVGRITGLKPTDRGVVAAMDLFYPDINLSNLRAELDQATVNVGPGDRSLVASATVVSAACYALVAAVTVDTSLPWAEKGTEWDGDEARRRMFEWATGEDGTVDVERLGNGFLYRDDDADPQTLEAWKLPVADIFDGEMRLVPEGVSAARGAVSGARGGVKGLSESDRVAVEARLATLAEHEDGEEMSDEDMPMDGEDGGWGDGGWGYTAAGASKMVPISKYERPLHPKREWFDDPKLTGPTPPTVTPEGEFFGHMADWKTCHRAFVAAGMCFTPPKSHCDYCEFKTNSVVTASGEKLRVGAYMVGGKHASLDKDLAAAQRHYDDLGSVAALVAAGEDEHGIWFHGGLVPGASDLVVHRALAYPPSGDWREPRPGADIELAAVTAVPMPGYVVQAHVASGAPTAIVVPYGGTYEMVENTLELDKDPESSPLEDSGHMVAGKALIAAAVDMLAHSIGRTRTDELSQLDALVHP